MTNNRFKFGLGKCVSNKFTSQYTSFKEGRQVKRNSKRTIVEDSDSKDSEPEREILLSDNKYLYNLFRGTHSKTYIENINNQKLMKSLRRMYFTGHFAIGFLLEYLQIKNFIQTSNEDFLYYLCASVLFSGKVNLLGENRISLIRIICLLSLSLLTFATYPVFFGISSWGTGLVTSILSKIGLGWISVTVIGMVTFKIFKELIIFNQYKNKNKEVTSTIIFLNKFIEIPVYGLLSETGSEKFYNGYSTVINGFCKYFLSNQNGANVKIGLDSSSNVLSSFFSNFSEFYIALICYIIYIVAASLLGKIFDSQLAVKKEEQNRLLIESNEKEKFENSIPVFTGIIVSLSYFKPLHMMKNSTIGTFNDIDGMLGLLSFFTVSTYYVAQPFWEHLVKHKKIAEGLLIGCLCKLGFYLTIPYLVDPYQYILFGLLGIVYGLIGYLARSSVNFLKGGKLFLFSTSLSIGPIITFTLLQNYSYIPYYCVIIAIFTNINLFFLKKGDLETKIKDSISKNEYSIHTETFFTATLSAISILYYVLGPLNTPFLLLLYYIAVLGAFYYTVLDGVFIQSKKLLFRYYKFWLPLGKYIFLYPNK